MSNRATLGKGVGLSERRKTKAALGDGQANMAHGEELIPGIPDVITLDQIATKLPWRAIHILLFVSRGWCHAIRSRQVYDARVRSDSTEILVLANRSPVKNVLAVTLHTVREDEICRYDLPRIRSQFFGDVVPPMGRSVTLDGKVYVFGGLDCKVHVLDVAGHGKWKRCASMQKPREEFGCGVLDGKIFVHGGAVSHEGTEEIELYNPKERSWSPVRFILSLRCGQPRGRGVVQGRTGVPMFGHGREYTAPMWSGPKLELLVKDADLLEVYDPTREEWRVVERVGRPKEKLFVAGQKFYSMTPLGIYVYDFHGNSWALLHSFSLAAIVPVDNSVEFWPLAILPDDHELIAAMDWPEANRSYVVQSRGLGSQNEELVWQKAQISIPFGHDSHITGHFVHTLKV